MSTTPTIVAPGSDIVGNATHDLKKDFSEIIGRGQLKIEVDLERVSMIDSLGIGVLVATRNSIRRANGEFSIINLSPDLTQLFANMRIIEFLNIN